MGRFVQLKSRTGLQAGAAQDEPDNLPARLVKLVPTEIVSIFTLAYGGLVVAEQNAPGRLPIEWCVGALALACLIATLAYVWNKVPADDPKARLAHRIVSPVAFLAWAYPIAGASLGGLFDGLVAILAQAAVLLLALFFRPEASAAAQNVDVLPAA